MILFSDSPPYSIYINYIFFWLACRDFSDQNLFSISCRLTGFHLGRFQNNWYKQWSPNQIPNTSSLPHAELSVHTCTRILLSCDLLRTPWLTNRRWSRNLSGIGNEGMRVGLYKPSYTFRYASIGLQQDRDRIILGDAICHDLITKIELHLLKKSL